MVQFCCLLQDLVDLQQWGQCRMMNFGGSVLVLIWEKQYIELIDSICVLLLFVKSWTNQLLDLALKSPTRIVKAGSLLLILNKRFSRDRRKCSSSLRKCSNSLWFWLGERYKVITYPFLFPMTTLHATHSGRFILLICLTETLSL